MRGVALVALALAGCTARLTPEALRDPAACKDCHPDHYREWSGSMHAYAAEDPVFRAMNARGQRETSGALGDFCVGCHAPMAVRLGLTQDGENLDEVPRELHGITCVFCHSVTAVEGEHNNPLVLADDGVLRGGIPDPVDPGAHAAEYSPLHDRNDLRSASLCGSCHDIVTPKGVHLERTYLEWKDSLYSKEDSTVRQTCGHCHMPGREGLAAVAEGVRARRVHEHAFPGVDVALTDFPEVEHQRRRVLEELDRTLLTQLCVDPGPTGATIEVRLENIGAGHHFPSGAAQDRDVRVLVTASFRGVEVPVGAEDGGPLEPWRYGDHLFDAAGREVHMFWAAERVVPSAIPAPVTNDPTDPEFVRAHVVRRLSARGLVDQVELAIEVRPLRPELLHELVEGGDLAPAVAERVPVFRIARAGQTWTLAEGRRCAPE